MDENTPLESPKGNWWNDKVNRREAIWLGISGSWAAILFGWMLGWTQFGEQNQIGPTTKVSTEDFNEQVQAFKDAADTKQIDGEELFVPAGNDVYVGARQWAWDGLPVVLEQGKDYTLHLSSYDVQHGLSVRDEDNLSRQLSLQIVPGYDWQVDMNFDQPGTYHVICNEFCGNGHRSMHGKIVVE